ncbi:phospholipid carrier-dependent glycosyltransferase [Capillibacterium thermochitinicola]|uniref:Polyprenol-phosphate-mannose--protein mannosyltransferase n=1 Tax=Capillibacterium thermochitinicola TaxID=2699427 RepID=A0A8J6I0I2_9FIRM|nr:phospholipid carrier-dependent glycosyltransferase [Capillibacterium thermochitinicola]MBA2133380.1 phospholipid carrier-dependent glycosyltransferase [Capillibacterium thermochitinicola]
MRKLGAALTMLFLMAVSVGILTGAAEGMLPPNGGFEEGVNATVYYWMTHAWDTREGVTEFHWDDTQSYTGQKSVCIVNNEPNDARYKQQIRVKGDTYYRLSCYVKTENVGHDHKGANISVEGIIDTSQDIRGTTDQWTYIEMYGRTGRRQETLTVTVGLGGYGSLNTGKAYFDEVVVEEVTSLPPHIHAVNLFPPEAAATLDRGSNLLTTVISVFALLVAVFLVVTDKGDRPPAAGEHKQKQGPGEEDREQVVDGQPGRKPGLKDWLLILVPVLVYLCFALPRLGTTAVPKTGWQPVKPGESFLVEFGETRSLTRIYYYAGSGEGQFQLEYQDKSGVFRPLITWQQREFYKWNYLDVNAETARLKFTVVQPGAHLLELAFVARDAAGPVGIVGITEQAVDPLSEGAVENLFDEQETIDYRASFLTGTYFDEIYHARTAYEHLKGIEPYETTHPPLGKVLIAAGIALFGMNPFGWRIMGVLFGAGMIPVMYLFAKKIFGGYLLPLTAAFLLIFDFMHFTLSRIATIDVYTTFFILLMYYFMYDYFTRKSYQVGFKESLKPLFWCGLSFGLGVAVKWISLYAGVGLAILFFSAKAIEYFDYRRAKRAKPGGKGKDHWTSRFVPYYINRTFLFCVVVFVLIPAVIYLLSYLPFLMLPGPGHGIKDVISYQKHMYNYHSRLVATHPFASPWWEWPIIRRPIWLYSGQNLPPGVAASIVSMGNPAIWWLGLLALIPALVFAVKKREKSMVVVFIAMAFQYLPWVLVPRLTFIYHFFSTVPFLILAMVYLFQQIIRRYPAAVKGVYLYLGLVGVMFLLFYPVLSGLAVPSSYVQSLRWFKTWFF